MKKIYITIRAFITVVILFFIFSFINPSIAQILPVDFSTWTPEAYVGNSYWYVSPDGRRTVNTDNGLPILFYSDFNTFNTTIQVKIVVTNWGDDDYIGFALGFQPGDTSNPDAEYILIDWKKNTQFYDYANSCTPGSTAYRGLCVSRVFGIPTPDELWGHMNFDDPSCTDTNSSNGVQELARAINIGNTGWEYGREYLFKFEFSDSSLKIFVDNQLEIDISGSFTDGRLAFYNFSQIGATYSACVPMLEEEPMLNALAVIQDLIKLPYGERKKVEIPLIEPTGSGEVDGLINEIVNDVLLPFGQHHNDLPEE